MLPVITPKMGEVGVDALRDLSAQTDHSDTG
jgi:hypothetical protein